MHEWSYNTKCQPHTFTHNPIIIMSHWIWCQPRWHRPWIVYDLPMLMSIVRCQGFLCHISLMAIAPAQMFMPYRQVLMSIAPAQDCSCHIHNGVHCSTPRVYATPTLMSIAPPQDCLCHTHIDVHCSIPRVYAIPTLMSIAPTDACLCHTHIDAIAPSHYLWLSWHSPNCNLHVSISQPSSSL